MKRGKQVKGITERRRADGTIVYEVVGRLGKKVKRIGTYLSRTEAVAAEQERQVNQRKINRGEMSADYSSRRTMDQAASDWLGSLARGRSRSHSTYERVWRLQLRDRIGGSTKVAAVREADVMRVRDDLAVHYAPATVKGALTCLSAAFTYFKKRGWVISNPCHGVRSVENPERAYNWIETHAEVARLLAACGPTLLPIVAVALLTGMRIDEILHLQWADVDLPRRVIAVHRGRQGTAKSGRLRRLPILDALLPVLREWRLQSGGSPLVFPGTASHPMRRRTDSNLPVRSKQGVGLMFKRALRRAQLDTSLRFHDLRHSFASHWMSDGGDIFKLSKLLGHSSVTITEKIYAHLAPDAYENDYARLAFQMPAAPANVYSLRSAR
jgi:integrase